MTVLSIPLVVDIPWTKGSFLKDGGAAASTYVIVVTRCFIASSTPCFFFFNARFSRAPPAAWQAGCPRLVDALHQACSWMDGIRGIRLWGSLLQSYCRTDVGAERIRLDCITV